MSVTLGLHGPLSAKRGHSHYPKSGRSSSPERTFDSEVYDCPRINVVVLPRTRETSETSKRKGRKDGVRSFFGIRTVLAVHYLLASLRLEVAWIFQGSPAKFDIDDYLSRYPELVYWRTPRYAEDIAVGDRAFIWRAGQESGAIAIGTIMETPVPRARVKHPEALGDDLWIAEKPHPGEPETGIHIEELRLTAGDNMIPRDIVKSNPVLGATQLIRMPNATVFKLSAEETRVMEGLWGVGATLASASSSQEGERRLRAHHVRERSPRLREDKIKEFRRLHKRLFCELCMEEESGKYPPTFGERVFEVHHRAPLAAASTPVRTTLNDLVVLCANCHRSVHATKDVDGNFKLLSEHFARS